MFQALRVVYVDGTDHWFYPESRTSLKPLTLMDRQEGKAVASIQAYIYFNLASSKTVASVTFTADAEMRTAGLDKQTIEILTTMPISKTVTNPGNATDVYVISSTITAAEFENFVGQSSFPIRYYVIALKNINAQVTFSDGVTKSFGLTGIQASENQLWWRFQMPIWGSAQIVSESVEWVWI